MQSIFFFTVSFLAMAVVLYLGVTSIMKGFTAKQERRLENEAEEAKEMCVPIVTYGIGCLYERVVDKITGFIAKNENEFAKYSLDLINHESIYILWYLFL